MDTPTYQAAPEPDRTPRANPIVDQPATVADCGRDFGSGASVRAAMDKQDARKRA